MKTRTIGLILGTMLVTLTAVIGLGAAIDASDGSIDAFDDKKWEATGNDGRIESGDQAYNGSITAQRDAYDFGVSSYRGDPTICTAMTQAHDEAVSLTDSGADAVPYLKSIQDAVNGWITEKATDAAFTTSDSPYAVSGMWDELARDCPEALFNPTVTGRP